VIGLAPRARAPTLLDEHVIGTAQTIDFNAGRTDDDRFQTWRDRLDPADLGKHEISMSAGRHLSQAGG
jgi:hypothetical protein